MRSLSIDLRDPEVQRQLGTPAPLATGKASREVVRLAGDVPDPLGYSGIGIQSEHRLGSARHEVVVVYGDVLMTVDVYALPGEPIKLHLYCPRCHNHSTVDGARKAIAYDAAAPNPMRASILGAGELPPEIMHQADLGRLSVEPFECSWEMKGTSHARGGLHTGASLCRLRIAIDNNRAKDA